MEGKKKYFALVIFLFVGMITYTFANPKEELVTDDVKTDFVDYSKQQTRKTEAEKIVEKVELEPTEEKVQEALTVIEETVTNQQVRQNLNHRVEQAKEAIDVAALVTNVENMIKTAENVNDITKTKNYFTTNNIEQEASNMTEGNTKENIQKRINYINEVFNDNASPEIKGIENGAVTNKNVNITIVDDVNYEVEVLLNNEKIAFAEEFDKEGIYVINVVDDATHQATKTFTIDKTKPTFVNIKSGDHVTNYIVQVEDLTEVTITLQKDHGEFVEIQNQHNLTEEGTYQIIAIDKAGNKTTLWLAIDKTAPTISGVTNNSYVQKCDRAYIRDRYLTEVTIDGTKYTRSDFTSDKRNENFEFEYRICSEGVHTITAKDKIGNVYKETFTTDKTDPEITNVPEEGAYVKEAVTPKVFDANLAKVILMKNGQEVVGYDMSEITEDGVYVITAIDKAGRETIRTFIIDKTAPEITFNGNVTGEEKNIFYLEKGANTGVVKITANLVDNIDEARKLTPYRLDFEHAHNNTELDEEKTKLDSSKEGTYKFYYKAKDKTGNEVEKILYVIVRDTKELKVLSTTKTYDEKTKTVLATIVASKDLNEAPNGWTQSLSKLSVITKKYYENTTPEGENVKITDLLGNELIVNIVVDEIKTVDELILTEDMTLDETMEIDENRTKIIDLNGHTLTVKNNNEESNYTTPVFTNNGKLIIKNGKLIYDSTDATIFMENSSTGELTLDKLTIEDKGTKNGSSIVNKGGKLTITNSKYTSTSTTGKATINSTGELLLKDTEITNNSQKSYAVITNDGNALIENVKITTGRGGIAVTGGIVTLNNNDVYVKQGSNGYHAVYVQNSKEANVTINSGKYSGHRNAINIYGSESSNHNVLVTVNGGTFEHKHTNTKYSAVEITKNNDVQKLELVIKGGTFKKTRVDKYLPEGYTQDSNFTVSKN